MRSLLVKFTILLPLLAACHGTATPTTGTIRGVVQGGDGLGLASVPIRVDGVVRGTSGPAGAFTIDAVAPGDARVVSTGSPTLSTASARVAVTAGGAATVVLACLPMRTATISDASVGGAVNDPSGFAVTVPAGGLRAAGGAAASGDAEAGTVKE